MRKELLKITIAISLSKLVGCILKTKEKKTTLKAVKA